MQNFVINNLATSHFFQSKNMQGLSWPLPFLSTQLRLFKKYFLIKRVSLKTSLIFLVIFLHWGIFRQCWVLKEKWQTLTSETWKTFSLENRNTARRFMITFSYYSTCCLFCRYQKVGTTVFFIPFSPCLYNFRSNFYTLAVIFATFLYWKSSEKE